MIRRFKILDSSRKDAEMGEVQYNTETKEFRVLVLSDYKGKNPDVFLEKYSKLGMKELPPDSVQRWIKQRICPPNRHAIGWLLKCGGLSEYDEFAILEVNQGKCAKDDYWFREITD